MRERALALLAARTSAIKLGTRDHVPLAAVRAVRTESALDKSLAHTRLVADLMKINFKAIETSLYSVSLLPLLY